MSTVKGKWKRVIDVCKYIYTPLILACIIYFVFQNSGLLLDIFSKAKLSFLVSAVFLWTSLHLLAPISPYLLLRSLGYPLSYKKLLKIHVTRLPARYLPGGVWHTVGRIADYRSCGISKRHLTIFAFLETVFPIPVTFFMGGVLLALYSPETLPNSLGIFSIAVSGAALLVPFSVLIWNPFKNHPPSRIIFFYICLLILSFIFWFLAAGSFIFYFNSVELGQSVHHSLFSLAGAYIYSWGTGYISIFAPQGIGVFEFVAGKLIDLPLSLGSTVAFMAGFRLIALLADMLIYLSFAVSLFKVSDYKKIDN